MSAGLHDIVLLGGGHAHVEVLRAFGMRPAPGVRLTLIGRDIHTPYSGMLPGLIAGHYHRDETHIDLAPLCRFAGARLFRDTVVGIDPGTRQIRCAERPPVRYDTLSIDTGATPSFTDVAGAAEHAIPVKPIDRFAQRWQALRDAVLRAAGPCAIGVVGAGAGGVELLLAARHALRGDLRSAGGDPDGVRFHLFSGSGQPLAAANARARRIFARHLAAGGIQVHAGSRVAEVRSGGVVLADGRSIDLDHVLWVTDAAAAAWPRESGLACDEDGFILVDGTLRSLSHREIFAAGDIATMWQAPRPKAGVFAVRQGPPLAANLRAAATGGSFRRHRPQRRYLSLIATGPRHAVALRGPFAVQGEWVWRWKDRIDRRFMRRYAELPQMPEGEGAVPMRCAGCGAKVGHNVLVAGLGGGPDRMPAAWDEAALDDATPLPPPEGRRSGAAATAQREVWASVDGFRLPVDDPWRAGRIAVHHAMSDLHAMGAAPSGALVFAVLPEMPPDKQAEELGQVMAGVRQALAEEGAVLVGGHTAEGAEAMLAVTATGYLPANVAPWRKSGLKPGDRLLLTRPLGTGILLAAAMRGRAKGRWWHAAIEAMCRGQGPAAAVLRRFGAEAVTDVTGFGLGGHLAEMLLASGRAAVLDLDTVPLLDGAAEIAASGIASTAIPAARDGFPAIALALEAAIDAGVAPWWRSLLFDPQTGGGLLAGLPEEVAEPAVAALRAIGCQAALIGRVGEAGPPAGAGWALEIR